MEIDVVDGAQVSRQLVQDPPRGGVPHVNKAVCRSGGHHCPIRAPFAFQEVLLEIVLWRIHGSSNPDSDKLGQRMGFALVKCSEKYLQVL